MSRARRRACRVRSARIVCRFLRVAAVSAKPSTMLLSLEAAAAFGASALLSFTVFTTILLLVAAKRGLLQASKSRKKGALSEKILDEKLLPQRAPPPPPPPAPAPAPSAPELTPPGARRLLAPRH